MTEPKATLSSSKHGNGDFSAFSSGTAGNDDDLFPFGGISFKDLEVVIYEDDESIDETVGRLLPLRETLLTPCTSDSGSAQLSEEDRKIFALFAAAEEPDPAPSKPRPNAAASAVKNVTWDRTYLLKMIGNEDILQALTTMISSSKSNDEIQDQLFDLLGFEKIELISKILENRPAIMKSLNREEVLALAHRNKINAANSTQAHPVIGVTIQSAQDKVMDKMYRKMVEKNKSKSGGILSEALSQADKSDESRNLEHASSMSRAAPFRPPNGGGIPLDCPNVYDSFAEIKQKAGFISGQKIILSDNMVRNNTSTFEEISIPPEVKQVPKNALTKELIKISSLDPIGQDVFRGMDNLNRIQTLVFETAYKTNENLLVCAPTGAGKTNIALLSVLHCIKNHIEGGTIMKDQFKVIRNN